MKKPIYRYKGLAVAICVIRIGGACMALIGGACHWAIEGPYRAANGKGHRSGKVSLKPFF